MSVLDVMKAQSESMTQYRRWLHHHAELAWEEFETTEFIENKLREAGIQPYRYGDRTGCGAMIRGGKAGENAKTILLRADIDAMPGHDKKNLPYSRSYTFHCCLNWWKHRFHPWNASFPS